MNLTSSGWHISLSLLLSFRRSILVMWAARIVRRLRYFSTNPSSKYFDFWKCFDSSKIVTTQPKKLLFLSFVKSQKFAFLSLPSFLGLVLEHLDLEILIVTPSGDTTNNKTSCEANFYQLILISNFLSIWNLSAWGRKCNMLFHSSLFYIATIFGSFGIAEASILSM